MADEPGGNLLPMLHRVQAAFGHVSEDAIRAVAAALNLSRAEVHGVVSFYHDFRDAPDARPVIKLCRAEACQARGADALAASLPDQDRVQIETVYCLGLCSVGPNALVGERPYARLDAAKFAALVEQAC
ncbi:MAG: formate dehydrogenase subunit gamma [Novosphingobium sp.]